MLDGRFGFITFAAALACSPWVSAAHAQCGERWLPGPGHAGIDGQVWAAVADDPDGDGPAPEQIYVGGQFAAAGDQLTFGVARWDGTAWHPLGAGILQDRPVYALLMHRGDLFVGGEFNRGEVRGYTGIGKWNGASWERLELGLNGYVQALTEFEGDVIAGGNFWGTMAGLDARRVARWDGQHWHALGDGMSDGYVKALAVYRGELIAAGAFTASGTNPVSRIARWDGTQWQPLGAGLNGTAVTMVVDGDTLVVGGEFTLAGSTPVANLARWNGSEWSALPSRLAGTVRALVMHEGELHVGGYLQETATGQRWRVAVLRQGRWQSAIPSELGTVGGGQINALFSCRQGLLLGGQFSFSQPQYAENCALLTATDLRAMPRQQGFYLPIFDSAVSDGRLVVTGVNRHPVQWGENVVRWDGQSWDSMSLPPLTSNLEPKALLQHDGELYIGGFFYPFHTSSVCRRVGDRWVPIGRMYGPVVNLISIGSDVYAFGTGMTQGPPVAGSVWHSVCKLEGDAWVGLRGSIGGGATVCSLNFNGTLVMSGGPPFPPGVQSNIVAYDGVQWREFAPGLPVSPVAMCAHGDGLVASGNFGSIDGVPTFVARWDGARWIPMPGLARAPRALVEYHGRIYAGVLYGAQETACGPLCRWTGQTWENLGMRTREVSWDITHLTVANDELIVGGQFTRAGSIVSVNMARWTDTNTPWLSTQPASATVSCGESATLEVRPARGYEDVHYAWSRDGIDIDPADPHYSMQREQSGCRLVILTPNAGDTGNYTCRISNACSSIISHSATLVVCIADLNCDGGIDGGDVESFVNAWEGGDLRADANADGGLDSSDLQAFFERWERGC